MTRGVLNQDLGMLIAMFMSGLAAGSWAIDRWVSRASRADGATARDGIALLVGLTILAYFTAWALLFTRPGSLAGTAALIMAAGLFTGGLFAYASLRRVESQVITQEDGVRGRRGQAFGCRHVLQSIVNAPLAPR